MQTIQNEPEPLSAVIECSRFLPWRNSATNLVTVLPPKSGQVLEVLEVFMLSTLIFICVFMSISTFLCLTE